MDAVITLAASTTRTAVAASTDSGCGNDLGSGNRENSGCFIYTDSGCGNDLGSGNRENSACCRPWQRQPREQRFGSPRMRDPTCCSLPPEAFPTVVRPNFRPQWTTYLYTNLPINCNLICTQKKLKPGGNPAPRPLLGLFQGCSRLCRSGAVA